MYANLSVKETRNWPNFPQERKIYEHSKPVHCEILETLTVKMFVHSRTVSLRRLQNSELFFNDSSARCDDTHRRLITMIINREYFGMEINSRQKYGKELSRKRLQILLERYY